MQSNRQVKRVVDWSKSSPSPLETFDRATGFRTRRIWNPARWGSRWRWRNPRRGRCRSSVWNETGLRLARGSEGLVGRFSWIADNQSTLGQPADQRRGQLGRDFAVV